MKINNKQNVYNQMTTHTHNTFKHHTSPLQEKKATRMELSFALNIMITNISNINIKQYQISYQTILLSYQFDIKLLKYKQ